MAAWLTGGAVTPPVAVIGASTHDAGWPPQAVSRVAVTTAVDHAA